MVNLAGLAGLAGLAAQFSAMFRTLFIISVIIIFTVGLVGLLFLSTHDLMILMFSAYIDNYSTQYHGALDLSKFYSNSKFGYV